MTITLVVSALNAVQAGRLATEQARRSQGWDRVSILSTRMVGANSFEVRMFVSTESGVPL